MRKQLQHLLENVALLSTTETEAYTLQLALVLEKNNWVYANTDTYGINLSPGLAHSRVGCWSKS